MRITAGRYKGRALPEAHDARPAPGRWKGSLFSVLDPYLEGARVLDVFAGTGALGLEALSRGAARVTLVERDAHAAAALDRWIVSAREERRADVQRRDVFRGLPRGPYDIAFADPPFDVWEGPRGAELIARVLAVVEPGGVAILKIPAGVPVPESPLWGLVRRKDIGSVAWAIVRATEAPAPAAEEPETGPAGGSAADRE